MNTQSLIITEKPSVARAIAFALGANVRGDGCIHGNGLIVSWCNGHLVELAVGQSVVLKDPAHVVEQAGGRQHDGGRMEGVLPFEEEQGSGMET